MDNNTKRKWKVCVKCMTYNQSNYIKDALKGFVMQKTTFPYVCCIVDDASTDGEQKVIKKYIQENFDLSVENSNYRKETDYAHIIFCHHQTNKNCYFAVILLKQNLYSKGEGYKKLQYISEWLDGCEYEALCEGDDYWTSPFKLQRQVDFLDNNPDYSCCYCKCLSYDQKQRQYRSITDKDYRDIYKMLWKDVSISTCTFVYRSELFSDYQKEINPSSHHWLMGDKPLFFYMGYRGKTKLLPELMACYRILESSASHSKDIDLQLKRARNTIDIYHFFADKYFKGDKKLSLKIEGGYLYRAYLIYKDHDLKMPADLKNDILKYNGRYYKIYAVKVMLLFPFLERIVYGGSSIFHKLKTRMIIKR